MLSLDLPGAAVKLYSAIRSDRELQNWIRLVLSCLFSAFITFTGTCGAALVGLPPFHQAHAGPVAVGWGLVWTAVIVLTVLLRDPRGRTLTVAAPQPLVAKYQEGIGGQGATVIEAQPK